jgi:hypothetical protein
MPSRTCPPSLDTLASSVPPAVKLAPASANLDDFVACYNPKNRHERKPADRFRSFTYEDLLKHDP